MQSPGLPPMPTLRVIDPRRARRQQWLLIVAWVLSVTMGYVIGRYVMIPEAGGLAASLAEATASNAELRTRLEEVEQRLANVERAEQIARLANENVQSALAGKDTEIANLRRDLALYNRLLGPEAERQDLTVYDVELDAADGGSYAFAVVLTQTQDTRRGSEGRLTLSIEGQRDGKMERLAWADLAAPDQAEGLAYDFRYFQRVEGRFILPAGFQPHSIRVRAHGRGQEQAERTLAWDQVTIKPLNQGD